MNQESVTIEETPGIQPVTTALVTIKETSGIQPVTSEYCLVTIGEIPGIQPVTTGIYTAEPRFTGPSSLLPYSWFYSRPRVNLSRFTVYINLPCYIHFPQPRGLVNRDRFTLGLLLNHEYGRREEGLVNQGYITVLRHPARRALNI